VKDVKIFIMGEGAGQIALNNLNSKCEELLFNSLLLMQYLCTVTQNISQFVQIGIVDELIKFLKGSGIVGVFFSDTILRIACQICRMIIETMEESKPAFLANLDVFYNILTTERAGYRQTEHLKLDIFNFCLKLISGDSTGKRKFGEKFADVILAGVDDDEKNEKKFTISDLKSRALSLLIILFKDVDGIASKVKLPPNFLPSLEGWTADFKDKGEMLSGLIEAKMSELAGKKDEKGSNDKDKKKGKKK